MKGDTAGHDPTLGLPSGSDTSGRRCCRRPERTATHTVGQGREQAERNATKPPQLPGQLPHHALEPGAAVHTVGKEPR